MEIAMIDDKGEASGRSVGVSDAAFGASFNQSLVHQVVTAYLSGARAGTKAQKSRAEVRGGGRKPWRQKGTGHARAGSSRNPIWRSGGVTFAAKPRDYSQKVNRKMYRSAMRSIVSELVRSDRLRVVESISVDGIKTRDLVSRLRSMGLDDVLIVAEAPDDNLLLSARNLHWAAVAGPEDLNPVSLMAFEHVLITEAAVKKLEERLQ